MLKIGPSPIEWKSNFSKIISLTSKSDPDSFARRLARSLYKRLPSISIPIDVRTIGSILDVKTISFRSLPDGTDSSLLPFGNGYAIQINSNIKSEARQRFSFCHEFAHILIEKYFCKIALKKCNFSFNTVADYREHEQLCNKIAAEILIPYDFITVRAQDRYPSIESISVLCNEFQASFPSMVRRLMELKIWKFGLINWYIKEDIYNIIENWHTSGTVPEQLIVNIRESPHLSCTYWTRKTSMERWSDCSIEHKSLAKNNVISFIW